MRVAITRVRNEEGILQDTLDHVFQYFDVIVVYDDSSTDGTLEILKSDPRIVVLENNIWESDPNKRQILEGRHRQIVYNVAKYLKPEWVYCFDADEFATFEGCLLYTSPSPRDS